METNYQINLICDIYASCWTAQCDDENVLGTTEPVPTPFFCTTTFDQVCDRLEKIHPRAFFWRVFRRV